MHMFFFLSVIMDILQFVKILEHADKIRMFFL